MSSDWWANQIGTAAAATNPGGIPQYALAADIGTAPWPDSASFKTWAEDSIQRSQAEKIERGEAKREAEELSWFNRALGGTIGALAQGVGFIAGGPFQEMDAEQDREAGQELLSTAGNAIMDAPVLGGALERGWQAYEGFYNVLETPFIASSLEDTEDLGPFWWADGSTWGQAWQLAEERSLGQAVTDWFLSGVGAAKSQKDLDRLKRTNSIYGITAFGLDLGISWKIDPTVIGARGVREAAEIRAGKLPEKGPARAAAVRVARGEDFAPTGLRESYGAWRGRRILNNFDDVFRAAEEMPFGQFSNLPMFRARNAVNGAAAAEMFRIAAKDEKLRDLTRRAVLADPKAWAEIRAMKEGSDPLIPGGRTYLDALDAQQGRFDKLELEVEDLERALSGRAENKGGFYDYYTKELHAKYEDRVADLEEARRHLNQYEDYASWLDMVRSADNPAMNLEAIKGTKPAISSVTRTFQTGLFGRAHSVTKKAEGAWLREANTIDLHRVDSGARSIRRQFEQFKHFWGYDNSEALDDILIRYTRAQQAGDLRGAAVIAKEVEEQHLVAAIAGKYGVSAENVTDFLNSVRGHQNDMVNALLSGDGAIYSTVPDDAVKLVSRQNGKATLEFTDGMHTRTLEVDEAELDALRDTANLAVDPTQTPNYYQPLNTYQIAHALKYDRDFFELMDSDIKNFGRGAAGTLFEGADLVGTKWNQFWKPLQLFRLAWPQRVLMDESLRGMAMLGASAWARNTGGALRNAGMNMLNPIEHPGTFPGAFGMVGGGVLGGAVAGPVGFMAGAAAGASLGALPKAIIKRRNLKIGPGPLADEVTGRAYDTGLHDAAADAAPMVPASFAPKRSAKRAAAVSELATAIRTNRAETIRHAAIARAMDRARHDEFAARTHAVRGGSRRTAPVIHSTSKYVKQANQQIMGGGIRPYGKDLPLAQAFDSWRLARGTKAAPPRTVIDPLNGKPVKTGYAVPVATADLRRSAPETTFSATEDMTLGGAEYDLANFVEKHADLLGNQGYRVMVEEDGDFLRASVVRVFRSGEKQKAVEFSAHSDTDRFIDLSGGHTEYLRDWSDKTPLTEALERRFVSEPERKFMPGDTPARQGRKKPGPQYHGSAQVDGLPEQLVDRYDAPFARGNLSGRGFYTSIDRAAAEEYTRGDPSKLYTIRGSRSGKKYKVFDLDAPLTTKDRDDLTAFAREWLERNADNMDSDATGTWQYQVEPYLNLGDNNVTWQELFEAASPWAKGSGKRADDILTEFLEEQRGAGALTHQLTQFQSGLKHQAYIWLNPEDLIVRPAYEKTGKFHTLEEWLDHPEAVESIVDGPDGPVAQLFRPGKPTNEVPESRIHRTGKKPAARARQANENLEQVEADAVNPDVEFDFDFAIDDVHERFLRRLFRRREFGKGSYSFRNPTTGERVTVPDALDGEGDIYSVLMSGAPAYARLTDSYKRTLNAMRGKAVGYKRYTPPDVSPGALQTRAGREAAMEYYTHWADLLNDQVRNSPIWYRMLEGQSDEAIVHWLENTAEGAKLRKNLPHKGYNPERWVAEHRQALNFYLPRTDLQALLRSQKIRPSDLRKIDQRDMPEVFGAELSMIEGTGIGKWWHNTVERVYTALGTTPTDLLSRQPFFRGMYQLKMRNLVAATDPEDLTEELVKSYAKASREFALGQVKRTMYELGDDTNFTQALRFVAPFWGAQQEAMTKWFSIAVERPETIARYFLATDLAYDRLTVVDEDNQPVKELTGPWKSFGYNPNHRVIFQVPKALQNVEPFKKFLAGQTQIGVSFGSMNTALQGDKPHLPGLGPLVTMPADQMARALWETQGTEFDDNFFYRWLFPVGRPPQGGPERYMEFIMPGWGRRMEQMRKGMDSRTYANTYFSVLREMEKDHQKRGLPEPTAEEINEAVKWHFALRTIAAFGAPVAMEWRPKHQFYLDQYHAMQQQYGPRAFEKFVEKHGADAARYAASSSESVGVPPTSRGMVEWKDNKGLIQKLVEGGREELVSAIISPDAWADDFSSDAYGAQFGIKLGPGSTQTLRDLVPPEQRVRDVEERLGWLEYRKFSSAIQAELFARGLTSTQQAGAEDLLALQRAKKLELAQEFPSWGDAMNNYSNNIYGIVDTLKEFAFDPQFDNRPDFQGVRQYLMIREQVAVELDRYYAETGGSRSLQAEENTELRNWFYGQVGALIQDNPAFGEFYLRYLDNDTLERGTG